MSTHPAADRQLPISTGYGYPIFVNWVSKSKTISHQPYTAEFLIHGEKKTMLVEEFNKIWSKDTKEKRLDFGKAGSFKVLYSPTLDHCSVCYYNLPDHREPDASDIINIGEISPGKSPSIISWICFFLKCKLTPKRR